MNEIVNFSKTVLIKDLSLFKLNVGKCGLRACLHETGSELKPA